MGYTPMMQQYFEVKDQYKDFILMYRLGDFYEMFFEDAYTASRELELTLTETAAWRSARRCAAFRFTKRTSISGGLWKKGIR